MPSIRHTDTCIIGAGAEGVAVARIVTRRYPGFSAGGEKRAGYELYLVQSGLTVQLETDVLRRPRSSRNQSL